MPANSIMQEIRNLLSQGQSSSEVIALGYKPPTVYKVQRQLRKKGQHSNKVPAPQNGPVPVAAVDTEGDAKKSGSPSLQEWLERHGWVDKQVESNKAPRRLEMSEDQHQLEPTDGQATENNPLQIELDQARSRIQKLEAEASGLQALRQQVRALQVEAETWQRRATATQETLVERHLNEAHQVIDSLMPP
jgi:hypothetical protein